MPFVCNRFSQDLLKGVDGPARAIEASMGSNSNSTNSQSKLNECSQEDHVVVELIEDPAAVSPVYRASSRRAERVSLARDVKTIWS